MNAGGTELIGQPVDYIVMLVYFVGIVAFGMYFGAYTRTTKDFFFGGQRFAWWLIAFSCIATTVGSYSFVKYSEVGFSYGISSTQSYLNDWFWVPILLLVWLPIIYYGRISSAPEYFERRFNRPCRVVATWIVLVYLVAYIGINLFTLGLVLQTLLGWPVMLGAFVTAVAVTVYVVAGGQTAVIMTDLVQGIILLAVGVALLAVGVWHFGGFAAFWSLLPEGHRYAFSDLTRPADFSALGIYVQDGLVNSGAFMLMNQGMIMRFLSMRSVKDAQKMAVCWILVLAPLAAIATGCGGWIAKALDVNGELHTSAKDAFVHAAHFLCAPGIFGFVLAALTAALMSTADTLINAVSAVFVNDVWQPFVRPGADDRHYLRVARVVSILAAVIGLAFTLVYATGYKSIYQAHAMITASVPAPMVVALLLGILWRGYTPAACMATLAGGTLLIGVSFVPRLDAMLIGPFAFGMGPASYTFMRALYGLAVCMAIGLIVSLFTKPRGAGDVAGLVTGGELDAMRRYKGGPINRRPGKTARVRLAVDTALSGSDRAVLSQAVLERVAADPGDIIYVSDVRWWFGGLRSVHLRAEGGGTDGAALVSPEALADAHLREGQTVSVEKLL